MNSQVGLAFEKALGVENSAWQEYNLEVAVEVLSRFSTLDWRNLQASVLSKPAYWQERCAESAGCIEGEGGVQTLMLLLQSPHMQVAGIAASELDNISVRLPAAYETTLRKLFLYLENEKSSRSSDVSRLISNLL